jgi:hypothetical protein
LKKVEEHLFVLFFISRACVRMTLGTLVIKEKCGFTDRETVEQITENPYLQYFIGLGQCKLIAEACDRIIRPPAV